MMMDADQSFDPTGLKAEAFLANPTVADTVRETPRDDLPLVLAINFGFQPEAGEEDIYDALHARAGLMGQGAGSPDNMALVPAGDLTGIQDVSDVGQQEARVITFPGLVIRQDYSRLPVNEQLAVIEQRARGISSGEASQVLARMEELGLGSIDRFHRRERVLNPDKSSTRPKWHEVAEANSQPVMVGPDVLAAMVKGFSFSGVITNQTGTLEVPVEPQLFPRPEDLGDLIRDSRFSGDPGILHLIMKVVTPEPLVMAPILHQNYLFGSMAGEARTGRADRWQRSEIQAQALNIGQAEASAEARRIFLIAALDDPTMPLDLALVMRTRASLNVHNQGRGSGRGAHGLLDLLDEFSQNMVHLYAQGRSGDDLREGAKGLQRSLLTQSQRVLGDAVDLNTGLNIAASQAVVILRRGDFGRPPYDRRVLVLREARGLFTQAGSVFFDPNFGGSREKKVWGKAS